MHLSSSGLGGVWHALLDCRVANVSHFPALRPLFPFLSNRSEPPSFRMSSLLAVPVSVCLCLSVSICMWLSAKGAPSKSRVTTLAGRALSRSHHRRNHSRTDTLSASVYVLVSVYVVVSVSVSVCSYLSVCVCGCPSVGPSVVDLSALSLIVAL